MKVSQDEPIEIIRSKKYVFYFLGILSLFVAFRSYTIGGPGTTALVWYFFPNISFEEGIAYFSYIGVIARLGGFVSLFVQKFADKIGRKPILIFVSLILTLMPLLQILIYKF